MGEGAAVHEAHHPSVHGGKSWGALALELLMIGVGVFLGLQVDQWKEERQHRELARDALENFRTELRKNEASIRRVLPYHRALRDSLETVFARPVHSLGELERRIGFRGSRSVDFAHTAYDLAVATQAMTYVPRDLAFALSDVYLRQQGFQKLQDSYMQAIYQPVSYREDNVQPVAISLSMYMGDVMANEPALLEQYGRILSRLDSALAKGR